MAPKKAIHAPPGCVFLENRNEWMVVFPSPYDILKPLESERMGSMYIGRNLQMLRKMRHRMTQEELAEKLGVSRQTVSKWELNMAYPEMEKVLELCRLFSCSMDQLIREDMTAYAEAYSDIRVERLPGFSYIRYAVISYEPEEDAKAHVRKWAEGMGIEHPEIIGWDFPYLSQEQINVYHLHGYEAALILAQDIVIEDWNIEVFIQDRQRYLAITIKEPQLAPFRLIPKAYKILITHMKINGIKKKWDKKIISCFEKEYQVDGINYMDVYIAIE